MTKPAHAQLAVGVDLGATKIATALVARDGSLVASRQAPTLAGEGFERICQRIADEVAALIAGRDVDEMRGVGIGSAGLVDGDAGVVRWAVNLGWKDVPLAPEVAGRLDRALPVFADNDANANALGEGFFGSARGCRHYALFTIGSGLGSGLVRDGRVVNGTLGMVSNLGHYALDPEHGMPCPCGRRGCAETIVSGPSLVAATRDLLATTRRRSMLSDSGALTSDGIVSAARAGDAVAMAAIANMSRVLGEVASVAAAVLGPEVIILGGGLGAAAADLLEPGVTAELSRRLPIPQAIPPVRAATLKSSAVGAACIVWSRVTRAR
jgi:glucokinase